MSSPPPLVQESAACPLGCLPGDETVLTGRDRLLDLPGEFRVVRCLTCGLLRTDPRPAADSIGFYYPPEYGPYLGTRVMPSKKEGWRRRVRRRVGRLLRRAFHSNSEELPQLARGRMLEIGCASGGFLRRMDEQGWQVEGLEFSPAAGEQARELGYPVQIGPLETAAAPAEPYDLVVGWMVLEHLHDPVGALRKLRDWTNPGGWLVASVPNAACYELSVFREWWYALHLPNHLWHPTPETLRRVLERGGWRVERFFYHRDLKNVVGSIGFWLSDRTRLGAVARWMSEYPEKEGERLWLHFLLYPLSLVLSLFHQTGGITVWARRAN